MSFNEFYLIRLHKLLESIVVTHGLLRVVVDFAHSSHEVAASLDAVDDLSEGRGRHVSLHKDTSSSD
jgi:hypothetical protein